MTDIPTGDSASDAPKSDANGQQPTAPGIRIAAQFIRDLSFENPRAPESLRVTGTPPQIDLGVELNAKGREDGLFEIELKLTTKATHEAQTVFQIELVYAGLFQVVGVEAEDMEQVLMIECPRYLFPFARRIISDLTTEGGFPPFRLEPLDFAQIYLARKAQAENQVVGNA